MRTERGLSLLELVVAIAVGAILAVGVLGLWAKSQEAYLDGADAADAQQVVRVVMDRIVSVTARSGLDPTGAGIQAFPAAGDTCLQVFADLTGAGGLPDGATNGVDEDVRFDWISGSSTLRQTTPGPVTEDLALNIVANPGGVPVFQYFNDAGAALPTNGACAMNAANLALVRLVRVTLTTRRVTLGQAVTKTLATDVRPRNLP